MTQPGNQLLDRPSVAALLTPRLRPCRVASGCTSSTTALTRLAKSRNRERSIEPRMADAALPRWYGETVTRRRLWLVAAGVTVTVAILGAVVRNQVKVYRGRQARAALMQQRHPVVQQPPAVVQQRQALFDMLQPVALTNCRAGEIWRDQRWRLSDVRQPAGRSPVRVFVRDLRLRQVGLRHLDESST